MKKILCPTDFSDVAYNAIAYAAKICQVAGAELILYHAVSLTERVIQEVAYGEPRITSRIAYELETQSRDIAQMFKISCYADVESTGTLLSKSIQNKSANYDLIVMGTNGGDELSDFFTGSHTFRVIQQSKIPVLLVPSESCYSEISKIVYAFNYLKTRSLPLAQLIPWVAIFKCELTVLQVLEEAHSNDVDDELKELQYVISQSNPEVNLGFDTTRSAEVSTGIDQYIVRNQIDILALCTHHTGFIETLFHKSVIKNISARSSYPVLVFHH
jgi:nucleotide-binding universal stress UspA family protein